MKFSLINCCSIFLLICRICSIELLSAEYLGNTSQHLFHFVHITDIHITHFGHEDRAEQFERFCNEIVKTLIKPPVTVVSGDLTHNRDQIFASKQYEEEWKIYKTILLRTNITKSTEWLDMRGNHDVFMDSDPESNNSFYRIYSNQGPIHEGSYEFTMKTSDNDTYSFIGIDLCPRPGAGRPFNFLGHLTQKELQNIGQLSERTRNSTATIFFGHYPLSFTYSKGLDKLMRHAIVYLNGHLHSILKGLYTRHSNGLLELELEDWKDNRRFRLITIDSGLLSFGDFRFDEPIYAVISNPKAAQFKTPREPLERLSQSSHIRIVIYSKWSIVDVRVTIDSKFIGHAIPSIDNRNLYVLLWNTSIYNDEHLHQISLEIQDNKNNTLKYGHQFCLSKSTKSVWTLPGLILFIHWPTFGLISLILTICVYILVLLFFRYRARRMLPFCSSCFTPWNKFRLRMVVLCSVDLFYYSLIGLAFYHFLGPWYIGYLTDEHFGAIFLWGTIIRGIFLPPDMQIFMGTIQFILFLLPLTFSLSSSCFYRYNEVQSTLNVAESRCDRYLRLLTVYLLFVYTLIFVAFWTFVTTASYQLAWLLSPFGLTLTMLTLFLFWKSKRLQMKDFHFQLSITNINNERSIVAELIEE